MNMLAYLPQDCMATSDVFSGMEDQILLVKNDDSDYYVPSYGVETLSEMCPGEAYAIFLNSSDAIDFTYPGADMAREEHDFSEMEDYKACVARDDVDKTGESHLVLFESISGEVQEGDVLRAYAIDKLVGSMNICDYHLEYGYPVDLVAHGSVDLSNYEGPRLAGWDKGDKIDVRLFSRDKHVELKVAGALDITKYGEYAQMSVGRAVVLDELATPTSFKLSQNYPNPFNPTTTIDYNVEASGYVNMNVYDIMGRLVRTLVSNQYRVAGNTAGYRDVWDGLDNKGSQVAAGLYIYRLQSGSMTTTNKMILLK